MIGPDNWVMVKCATPGCNTPEWLMHWPCEGTEEEIRHGQHFCVACESKKFEDAANADPVRSYPVKRIPNVTVRQDEKQMISNLVFGGDNGKES